MSRGHAEKFRADIAGVIEYAGHPMPIADLVPIALAVARAEWDKEHPPVGDQPMDPVAFRGMQRKAEETHQPAMAMALDAACRSWPTRLYLEDLQAGLFRALEAGEIVLRTHDGDELTASQISGALFDWIAGTAGGCHNTDRTFRGLRAGRPTAGAPAAPVRDPGEAEPDADRQCLAKLIEAGLIDETADGQLETRATWQALFEHAQDENLPGDWNHVGQDRFSRRMREAAAPRTISARRGRPNSPKTVG